MDVSRPCRLLLIAVVVGLSLSWLGAAPSPPPQAQAPFRILSDRPLPPTLAWANDVRWAGETSVYLTLSRSGLVKVSTNPAETKIEGVFLPEHLGGPFSPSRLGVSREYLAAAGPLFEVTWKKLNEPTRLSEAFDAIEDIDLFDDRLLVLGARRDAARNFAPEGAIVWMGSFQEKLSDLRPVLFDASGPGAPNLNACGLFEMGAVRFQTDGSFVVAPGVQPGIHLYDVRGRLVRTWDTELLGIDTDCGTLRKEEIHRLGARLDDRYSWLNLRTTIDDILPLPQGPALIVRKVTSEKTHWRMMLLRPNGAVETQTIPIPSHGKLEHLKGDVRGDKIVFLVVDRGRHLPKFEASRLVLVQIPEK